MSEATLFVRKASGLVRSWSGFDAFIYATFSINLITLGLFIFTYAVFIPSGSLLDRKSTRLNSITRPSRMPSSA